MPTIKKKGAVPNHLFHDAQTLKGFRNNLRYLGNGCQQSKSLLYGFRRFPTKAFISVRSPFWFSIVPFVSYFYFVIFSTTLFSLSKIRMKTKYSIRMRTFLTSLDLLK